ncbi:hypothetical protein Tco_1497590 [Tanacetum coccineum]
MMTQKTTKTNNNQTRGRTLVEPTLPGLVRRGSIADLCQNVPNELMDQKIRTLVERQIENKRKQDDNFRENQNQQQQNKRQNTSRAYTAGLSEKREYSGSLPKCSKSSGNANAGNNQRATRANQRVPDVMNVVLKGILRGNAQR